MSYRKRALSIRSWDEVRDEINRRHGIRLSNTRVQQIARRAEQKLMLELERMGVSRDNIGEYPEAKMSLRIREACTVAE